MTAIPQFTIRELLEAGVHFGHRTMRWNPRMAPYLFGSRNGTHIIDLQQTAPLLHQALKAAYNVAKKNGRILFVGTKRQASDPIADAAARCGQYYVNHRWLGGMLTNWKTVSASIKTLRSIESKLQDPSLRFTKKEILGMERQAEKLRRSLGGIMDMGGKPDLLFVIDTNKESLALQEAKKLDVPVAAIVDSNSNPAGIDYLIPGNDDATRSIELYCRLVADAVLAGIQDGLGAAGVDLGVSEKAPKEPSLKVVKNEEAPKKSAEKKTVKTTTKKEETKKVAEAVSKPAKKEAADKAEKPKAKKEQENVTEATKEGDK